ncbi:MAG: lipid-A-disaccharide synthase N-terminal domain-containing protein [Phycisphaerales bacterium]
MKRAPLFAMAALLALGFWLVAGPQLVEGRAGATPGSSVERMEFSGRTLRYEVLPDAPEAKTHRFLTTSPDLPTAFITEPQFWETVRGVNAAANRRHPVLKALNVSSWANVWWVVLGFAGQSAFFGRMLVQWVSSEREKRSIVPPIFWWLSLCGGVTLFTYFVWRRDVVGVLGQSTGVVIYARNLRLIYKERARALRRAARAESAPASS